MHPELADSRRRVAGARQVVRAVASGRLCVVFIAHDADERILHEVLSACEAAGISVEFFPTMAQLGKACRIEVETAAAGLLAQEKA